VQAIEVDLEISEAIAIRFLTMAKVFQGSIASIKLSLRDTLGNLYNPAPTLGIEIYSIDRNSELSADPLYRTAAVSYSSDGVVAAGVYTADFDTTGFPDGKYLLRAIAPYSQGKVIAQQVFEVVDPAEVRV
jgi:hypothetical protein